MDTGIISGFSNSLKVQVQNNTYTTVAPTDHSSEINIEEIPEPHAGVMKHTAAIMNAVKIAALVDRRSAGCSRSKEIPSKGFSGIFSRFLRSLNGDFSNDLSDVSIMLITYAIQFR